jgi:hypothetical protein
MGIDRRAAARCRGAVSVFVTLSVIRVRIPSSFLHFRSASIAGVMLKATRPVERNPDHDSYSRRGVDE